MEITTAGGYVAIRKETKLEFTANRNDLHHLSLKEEIPQLLEKCAFPGSSLGTRWVHKKFNTGRLRPRVQPLTLLYTILDGKSTISPIPFIDKWYLFHITSLELWLKPEKWYPLR